MSFIQISKFILNRPNFYLPTQNEKEPKNIFDKIGSIIPGYRGYAERDGRRICDKALRTKIAEEINKCDILLTNRIKSEIKKKNLESLQENEECRQKLNTLADKIRYAPYGESSFFGDAQIKEDELLKIYQLDYDLFSLLQESEKYIVCTTIVDILTYIKSIETLINKRNDYIKDNK